MQIGAQFYTIRDFCKDPDSLAESLKRVADIGYKTVQISGTCAYDPAWMDGELKKNGLSCVLTHNAKDRLIAEPAAVTADNKVYGCRYIGLGMYTFEDEKEVERLADFLKLAPVIGQGVKEAGGYFMYHNHDKEFFKVGGKTIMQHLADEVPADLMGFTLDTYWVQRGGGDPAWWLENLKGRVPCIHLKDYAYGHKMAVVGEGNINFDRVFEKAEAAGTRYMLVEQDKCYDEDPFDCLKRSYQYLKANGFQ